MSGVDPQEFRAALDRLQQEMDHLRMMISGASGPLPLSSAVSSRPRMSVANAIVDREGSKVIEGTFDGQNMTAPDGKQYSVPANYASKSKLVEGDVLKLTITRDGSFIYKQIGPIDRRRVVGKLIRDDVTGEYRVEAEGQSYRLLLASVTYFKGEAGDEVVILLPEGQPARWAAVENIIKNGAFDEPGSTSVF
jgi:hypothetical protein